MNDGLPTRRRIIAAIAVSFGTGLVAVDGGIATVALPTIATELGVDSSASVLIVTVYQLVLVMTMLPFSALGERIGYQRLYQYGLALFTVSSFLCFFANSLPFLLVVRAFQALGAACAMSVSSAIIRSIYPKKYLGRGLALNTVIVTSSVAFAPAIGGLVLAVAPWQWVFAVAAPLGIASLILGRALPAPPTRDRPFDLMGALLSALFFGLVIAGVEASVHGDSPVIAMFVIATGLLIGYIFIRRSLSDPQPILPVDLLAQPVLALSMFSAFVAFVGSMTLMLSLPFRLQHEYGFTPAEIGAMMAPWPFAMMCITPISGMLSDRYPAGLLGGIGMAIASFGLINLALLPENPVYMDMAWRMALTGIGFSLFLAPNMRLVVGSSPIERAAAAGGMMATNRLVGQTLGATVAAAFLAHQLGDGPIPAFTAAGLTMIAAICSVARLRPAMRQPRQAEINGEET